ncbi:MAG: PH domain-containing protein, partial [Bacteroidia bacterium]|nr:PH domain-containing protein [Bacteroidia bacterium]
MRRSDVNIYEPTRQSIAAIVVLIFKFVKRLFDAFWPILLVLVFQGRGSSDSWIGIVGVVLGSISLLGSILAYFKYYFHVTNDEIIIQKGILKKTNLTIPFERVQAVDFEQSVIHQLLNVVKVKIDTAGSAKSELDIDALELPIAEQLRSIIIGYQKEHQNQDSKEGFDLTTTEKEERILSVDIPELIKVGISQNHLKTAGLILAFVGAIFREIEQFFTGFVSDRIDGIEGFFDNESGTW